MSIGHHVTECYDQKREATSKAVKRRGSCTFYILCFSLSAILDSLLGMSTPVVSKVLSFLLNDLRYRNINVINLSHLVSQINCVIGYTTHTMQSFVKYWHGAALSLYFVTVHTSHAFVIGNKNYFRNIPHSPLIVSVIIYFLLLQDQTDIRLGICVCANCRRISSPMEIVFCK